MIDFIPRQVRQRTIIMACLVVLCFGAVVARLFVLQILDRDVYQERARKQRERLIRLNPKRGTIFDRQNRELALSIDVDSVFVHPAQVEEITPGQIKTIARALEMSTRDVAKMVSDEKRSFLWLRRHISPAQRSAIEELDIKGIHFIKESRRYYPKGFLAGHVLGFAGIDNQGLEGIERGYDNELKGAEGWYVTTRDALNRSILSHQSWIKSPTAGYDLVLTIDEVIQYFAERELARGCIEEQARHGSVVVMNPMTGDILAIANYPPFNPNNIAQASPKIWRNRAVVDVFEPGSTMKAVVFAAALEEKVVQPDTMINCKGGTITFAGHTIKDWKPFQTLSAAEVLAWSSNVGSITVSERLGGTKLYEYLKRFGFGNSPGLNFPGMASGVLFNPKQWSTLSLPSLSIGYELTTSALFMTMVYGAIANKGIMMKPRLVKEFRNEQGEVIKFLSPDVLRTVISAETSRTLKEMLRGTVSFGTGSAAGVEGYQLCGKTGTVKLFDHSAKKYSSHKVLASFIGFGPMDSPSLAIGVFINEPKKNKWGSAAASPVFQKIMEASLKYMQVRQTDVQMVRLDNDQDLQLLASGGAQEVEKLFAGSTKGTDVNMASSLR